MPAAHSFEQLSPNGAVVLRQFLPPLITEELAQDYAAQTAAYQACFKGIRAETDFTSTTKVNEVPLRDMPPLLADTTQQMSSTVESITSLRSTPYLQVLIDGAKKSEPHKDALRRPALTFILVVVGSMFSEFGGTIRYSHIISQGTATIDGGRTAVLGAGDALLLDNTSNIRHNRPPHRVANASNCLRFVVECEVGRFAALTKAVKRK